MAEAGAAARSRELVGRVAACAAAAAGIAAGLAAATPAAAQWRASAGAGAAAVYTWIDHAPGGSSLDEARLVHLVAMGHLENPGRWLRVDGMLNLEGLTTPGGELTPGVFGEGFVDRRHPHTYLHELAVTAAAPGTAGFAASATVGKGFVPFGTDDPMSRPVVRYPVNHHFAQILERAIVVGAVRRGPVAIEGSLFNGDEPEEPSSWPNLERFGDSWAARVTVWPVAGVEAQVSRAIVKSPEHREGAGTTARKWSASGRWEGSVARRPVYLLGEWARTSEADGRFVYRSLLAEGAWTEGGRRLHYRFERTERPEEERRTDPFRSVRPHHDDSNLGTTRWTIHTAGLTVRLPTSGPGPAVWGLFEVSRAGVHRLAGIVIDPDMFYGSSAIWSVTAGIRLELGAPLHRMGRYGAATAMPGGAHTHQHP